MKKTAILLAVVCLLCAVPAIAQGPFTDVPTDHWAYDAINTLQKDGILIGYPDGTFAGKRTITRYEFAVAIARILPLIPNATPSGKTGLTQADLDNALSNYVKKSDLPDFSTFANKADVDALRKLIDEFKDELAQMGVDIDTLKKEVAALDCRVTALEAEVRRVKITGDANVVSFATDYRSGVVQYAHDLDQRSIPQNATLGRTISVVEDFDLNIVGRVSDKTTANTTIDYGNYLNYIGFVDDYVGGVRPVSKPRTGQAVVGQSANSNLTNAFFPYYLYINTAIGKGDLSVGRFPMQFTPYTLKKIDVDCYTSILKTDDGNYPVDGIKLAMAFSGADVTLFAVKNDNNEFLVNGLTGQPRNTIGTFNVTGGNAVGGLNALIDQTAGLRVAYGAPFGIKVGATFYQSWSGNTTAGAFGDLYDQAQVYGADLTVPFLKNYSFVASWTASNTLSAKNNGASDINSDDAAWDAKLTGAWGKLNANAGYKDIDPNFSAAGSWDRIGQWTNPVDVEGPYADVSYPIMHNVKLVANGEYLTVKSDQIDVSGTSPFSLGLASQPLLKDDKIAKAEGGIKWGISRTNALDLGYEWIKYNPNNFATEGTETYLTIGWAHALSPNTGFKIGYQYINWDGGSNAIVYGDNYRAGIGVVQFGVTF
jgi:hypothetical protein